MGFNLYHSGAPERQPFQKKDHHPPARLAWTRQKAGGMGGRPVAGLTPTYGTTTQAPDSLRSTAYTGQGASLPQINPANNGKNFEGRHRQKAGRTRPAARGFMTAAAAWGGIYERDGIGQRRPSFVFSRLKRTSTLNNLPPFGGNKFCRFPVFSKGIPGVPVAGLGSGKGRIKDFLDHTRGEGTFGGSKCLPFSKAGVHQIDIGSTTASASYPWKSFDYDDGTVGTGPPARNIQAAK